MTTKPEVITDEGRLRKGVKIGIVLFIVGAIVVDQWSIMFLQKKMEDRINLLEKALIGYVNYSKNSYQLKDGAKPLIPEKKKTEKIETPQVKSKAFK